MCILLLLITEVCLNVSERMFVWTCTRTSGVPNLNIKNVFSLHITLLQSVKTGSFKTNLIRT